MKLCSSASKYWPRTAKTTRRKWEDEQQDRQLLFCLPFQLTQLLTSYSLIFLGFALDKQSKYIEAEDAYLAATKLKASDPQGWQGLIQLYEKQGPSKLPQYQVAALKLGEIYQILDDKYRCQDVVDKFLGFAKNQGTRMQHKRSLEMVLPTSPIYDYLEGRVPHPSHTYQIMAQITEFEEKERINKEIGERRTRLGATISQVTSDVKREVLRDSDLEELYTKIIDWSNDDEVRRQYEEKLLQRGLETLTVLPPGQEKNKKRTNVLKLATDMVIIKHPYMLAWDVAIEWQDVENIQDLDPNVLREYYTFFPTSGLGQVLRGFMTSEISPFPPPPPVTQPQTQDTAGSVESEDDDDEGGGVALDAPLVGDDRLLIMAEGMSDAHKSILAHRLMGEYYQFLDEHESVVELMRNGQRLVTSESSLTGMSFEHSSQAIISLLGTALVFYQSPKNHPEAKSLFEGLLVQNPTSTPALMGVGLIYEEEEDYLSAIDFLDRALERDPSNVRIQAEGAWVRALNGDYAKGKHDLEACLPKMDPRDLRSRELLAQTQYRVGVCMWNIDTSKATRKARDGAYSYFIAALKSSLNFAPAYTSLGVFYADYAKDKKRARKCFQKAFELSPSEVHAAERLSRMFADQGEWELVGVVAQRVIDSGKVKPAPGSKKKGVSWPFAALGVAELNKQDYAKSIVSFQSALRITPSDYHSWVGLGESYHNSGRYMAAMKAFHHAEKFEHEIEQQKSGETWFAKYMLANVKRELGDFDNAIKGYKSVLQGRPTEFGVSVALVQTLVDSAWYDIDKGLFGQAAQRATETIREALAFKKAITDAFNLWKALGDACAVFSWIPDRMSYFPHEEIQQMLRAEDNKAAYGVFADVDGVETDISFAKEPDSGDGKGEMNLISCLHSAILCYKRAIHTSAHDTHAQAVAYYNLGWIEYRSHVCLFKTLTKRSTRYLKASVRCFKRAIELEAGNSEFWNALGVATSELNPKVAQHSFVRSLFLNERSAQTWTNLGALYLLQNDVQLANDAFTKAQSTDPDFAHAWVGQGLIALLTDNAKEAGLLFTHAMDISESGSVIVKKQYSQSTFDHILASQAVPNISDLVQPLFALKQLQAIAPSDQIYQHLSALFLERVDNVSSAIDMLDSICAKTEADYEITEAPTSLSRFSLGKADLARLQLRAGSYIDAIDSGETALQLSTEDSGNELSAEARRRCRLAAHITVGLAHYFSNNPKTALQYFQPALEESNSNPDAVCLLAQVLWAVGDDESRVKAQEYLFESVETHPDHVQSILLLGVIALLGKDEESLEAVSASLQDLRATRGITDREQAQISEVLRAIAELAEDNEQEVLTEIQTEVVLYPHQSHGWGRLASVGGDEYAADMALKTALRAVPFRGKLDASNLSEAFAGTGRIGDIQRAIMVAPWHQTGWNALSEVLDSATQ
jgi:superkiller protein 3